MSCQIMKCDSTVHHALNNLLPCAIYVWKKILSLKKKLWLTAVILKTQLQVLENHEIQLYYVVDLQAWIKINLVT